MRAKGQGPAAPAGSHGMAVVFGSTAVGALAQVIALASSLSHRLFGGDGFRVWLIEVGGDIVGLTLAGLAIGLIG